MKSLFKPILVIVILSFWALPNKAQVSKNKTPTGTETNLGFKSEQAFSYLGFAKKTPAIVKNSEELKSMTVEFLTSQKSLGKKISFKGGGGDAGGGNTFQNVTVEQLRKNTSELEEYEKFVVPVIRQIESDLPEFAKALKQRAENLSWYILPIQFENLPFELTELISLTDQSAVQNKNEVFVDSDKWLSKNPKQRANLILHEILEAQYFLLRKDSQLELKNPKDQVSLSDFRVISDLLQRYEPTKADELQKLLFDRNFGFYVSKSIVNEWNQALQSNVMFLKDQVCSESKIQEVKLSTLLPVLIFFKVELSTCTVYPFACSNLSKENQMRMTQFMSGLPAWVHLSQVYPKHVLLEITENSVKENFEDLFDRLYPGIRNQPEDLQLGKDVCSKADSLRVDKLVYGFGK